MIIGDCNANLGQTENSLFGPTMVDFCEENNLVISPKEILPKTHTLTSGTERITYIKPG